MNYLTKEYLITFAFERLIDESSQDFAETLANIEAANIDLIKTYIAGIYDGDSIFSQTEPIYNELLKKILAKLVIYDIVRRNAARNVPADYKTEFDWAIKQLENINYGKLSLGNLPPALPGSGGNLQSDTIFGNLINPDFYI